MNSYCQIVVFLSLILFWGNLYGGDLLIEKDGNYVSSDRASIVSNQLYRVSAVFSYETSLENQESYLQIGFVPYGKNGETICELKDFSPPFEREDIGFILLDALIFEKNSVCNFSRVIKLSGADLREVSFVAGASLAKGAKFRISQVKIEPLGDMFAGASASGGFQGVLISGGGFSSDKNRAESGKLNSSVSSISQIGGSDTEKSLQVSAGGHRIIYVNSDIGSDKFEGLKRGRGQADGPKKTIKSALKNALDGDAVVLQETDAGYKIGALKIKSNKTVVLRAEGCAVIKGN